MAMSTQSPRNVLVLCTRAKYYDMIKEITDQVSNMIVMAASWQIKLANDEFAVEMITALSNWAVDAALLVSRMEIRPETTHMIYSYEKIEEFEFEFLQLQEQWREFPRPFPADAD